MKTMVYIFFPFFSVLCYDFLLTISRTGDIEIKEAPYYIIISRMRCKCRIL